jgi:hypothetical protein
MPFYSCVLGCTLEPPVIKLFCGFIVVFDEITDYRIAV